MMAATVRFPVMQMRPRRLPPVMRRSPQNQIRLGRVRAHICRPRVAIPCCIVTHNPVTIPCTFVRPIAIVLTIMRSSGPVSPKSYGHVSTAPGPIEDGNGFPTILLVDGDAESRCILAKPIRQEGYLVLEAHDLAGALHIVQNHSRSIQFLVIAVNTYERAWVELVTEYRPLMQTLVCDTHAVQSSPLTLRIEDVVPALREFFGSRKATLRASA